MAGCADGIFISADGGLLSVLGDLLFAGAILMLLYPCVQRTWNRLDRNFFEQLFYILEIVVAVTLLAFLLMLLVAQQMRMTYCAVIRPFVGDTREDKIYAGVLLKLLVCVLLVFNYYCATGLQTFLNYISEWLEPSPRPHRGTGRLARPPIRPNLDARRDPSPPNVTSRDALSNNNTNSQAGVTQTVTTTRADVLPSMSFAVSSLSDRGLPVVRNQIAYRDVGTMVRFPGYQTPGPFCTLQFPAKRGEPGPHTIVLHQMGSAAPRNANPSSRTVPRPRPRSRSRSPKRSGPPKRSRSKCSNRSRTSSSRSSQTSSTTVNSTIQTSPSRIQASGSGVQASGSVIRASASVTQTLVCPRVVHVHSNATLNFPSRHCTVRVQRKRLLPPRQPKLLRSGKTYGYY